MHTRGEYLILVLIVQHHNNIKSFKKTNNTTEKSLLFPATYQTRISHHKHILTACMRVFHWSPLVQLKSLSYSHIRSISTSTLASFLNIRYPFTADALQETPCLVQRLHCKHSFFFVNKYSWNSVSTLSHSQNNFTFPFNFGTIKKVPKFTAVAVSSCCSRHIGQIYKTQVQPKS